MVLKKGQRTGYISHPKPLILLKFFKNPKLDIILAEIKTGHNQMLLIT
jgi:hypothetical protein